MGKPLSALSWPCACRATLQPQAAADICTAGSKTCARLSLLSLAAAGCRQLLYLIGNSHKVVGVHQPLQHPYSLDEILLVQGELLYLLHKLLDSARVRALRQEDEVSFSFAGQQALVVELSRSLALRQELYLPALQRRC